MTLYLIKHVKYRKRGGFCSEEDRILFNAGVRICGGF